MNASIFQRALLATALLLTGVILSSGDSKAHEVRPALLDITEREPGLFAVLWKVPVLNGIIPGIRPLLPTAMKPLGPMATEMLPGAKLERTTYSSNGASIVGETIAIDQLSTTQIDVLVQLKLTDGSRHAAILRPKSPTYIVPERETKLEVALSYWRMGTIHIIEGIDHLLFVFALILLVPSTWSLVKTITAFTVAHSITLGLAVLGYIHVPPGPTEAVIALSIVFLAVEVVRSREGRSSFTATYPWLIAFTFGLVHGLGFAGALSDIGLPAHDIPLALLMFNVGVETGQIAFIVVVLGLWACLKSLSFPWPQGSWRILPYTIGGVAAFWTIERVVSFLQVAA